MQLLGIASMLVIDTGTSWMFSTLRCAVTWTASRVVAVSCASAGGASRMAATAKASVLREGAIRAGRLMAGNPGVEGALTIMQHS